MKPVNSMNAHLPLNTHWGKDPEEIAKGFLASLLSLLRLGKSNLIASVF